MRILISSVLAILCAFVITTEVVQAQDAETLTRTVSKKIPFLTEDVLYVIGEKASIRVTGWQNDYVQVEIVFSSVNPDKKIAARELEYMQYSLSRDNHIVEIRNAFILPGSTDQIHSKLEVLIDLKVPAGIQLLLKNKYGDAEIKGLSRKSSVELEFSDLEISDMRGEFELSATYSEIRGEDLAFSVFKSNDSRSQLYLDLSAGSYTFQSRHSDLDLTVKSILGLKLESVRSNVTVRPGSFDSYNFALSNTDGKIFVPDTYAKLVVKDAKQSSLRLHANSSKPLIQIKTSFNSLTLK